MDSHSSDQTRPKTLRTYLQALEMIYRNMFAGRTQCALLGLFGLGLVMLFSSLQVFLFVTDFGYSAAFAFGFSLIPAVLWGVGFPMAVFLIDRARNPTQIKRAYDSLIASRKT